MNNSRTYYNWDHLKNFYSYYFFSPFFYRLIFIILNLLWT
jgi:hypothetical protein